MGKPDWVTLVDRALVRADQVMDRFRTTPRRRLADVPSPPPVIDPFTTAPAPRPEKEPEPPKPLGLPDLPAQIYGRRGCMWSGRAVKIFQELSIPAKFYDIDDAENRELEGRIVKETRQYQTPWVYLRGEFIGGYNALDEIHRLGQLEQRTLLEDGEEPRRRIKIAVASRPPDVTPEGERR